jgi:hypothetical protein
MNKFCRVWTLSDRLQNVTNRQANFLIFFLSKYLRACIKPGIFIDTPNIFFLKILYFNAVFRVYRPKNHFKKLLKQHFCVPTKSGLSIGIRIFTSVKTFFFVYFDHKGRPMPKKIEIFF